MPCRNQNGATQSPLWHFFRLRKSDVDKPDPAPRSCYCKIAGCDAVCLRTHTGGTKALSVHLEEQHGWSADSLKKALADAQAAGTLIEPKDHPEFSTEGVRAKRKRRADFARASREIQAAQLLADFTSEAGVVKQEGGGGLMTALPAQDSRRLAEQFVRKICIGDLRNGALQEGVGFADVLKEDLLPTVQAVHSWEPCPILKTIV